MSKKYRVSVYSHITVSSVSEFAPVFADYFVCNTPRQVVDRFVNKYSSLFLGLVRFDVSNYDSSRVLLTGYIHNGVFCDYDPRVIHVVQLSGGKDSQAVAKLIRSKYPSSRIIALFSDTGFEHPLTYEHVRYCADLYDLELVTLSAGTVPEQVEKWKRFPGGGARHCTQYLKIEPAKKYLIDLAENNKGFSIVSYLGVRSDESQERGRRYGSFDDQLYMPHEVMPSKYPK